MPTGALGCVICATYRGSVGGSLWGPGEGCPTGPVSHGAPCGGDLGALRGPISTGGAGEPGSGHGGSRRARGGAVIWGRVGALWGGFTIEPLGSAPAGMVKFGGVWGVRKGPLYRRGRPESPFREKWRRVGIGGVWGRRVGAPVVVPTPPHEV